MARRTTLSSNSFDRRGTILENAFPNRAASLVFEWAALHQRELTQNWRRLHNAEPVESIKPLE